MTEIDEVYTPNSAAAMDCCVRRLPEYLFLVENNRSRAAQRLRRGRKLFDFRDQILKSFGLDLVEDLIGADFFGKTGNVLCLDGRGVGGDVHLVLVGPLSGGGGGFLLLLRFFSYVVRMGLCDGSSVEMRLVVLVGNSALFAMTFVPHSSLEHL